MIHLRKIDNSFQFKMLKVLDPCKLNFKGPRPEIEGREP